MLTTSILVSLAASFALFGWLLSAALLRLGARWAKVPQVGMGRALATVALVGVASLAIEVLVAKFSADARLGPATTLPLTAALVLAAAWRIVQGMLRTSFPRAIAAWLPTLLTIPAAFAVTFTVIRPFLFETFFCPLNSMAPTVLGNHVTGTCPECGGPLHASPPQQYGPATEEELGICGNCLQSSIVSEGRRETISGDRFVVTKFLQPRRWDVILFRSPDDPSVNQIKRLVGMPGEEVELRNGEVWIDGQQAVKPAFIAKLHYLDPFSGQSGNWGPVRLGADEYFVLGDFSARSKDSRFWDAGAPGHPSYALPGSYIVGVVTHVYWPISRWTALL